MLLPRRDLAFGGSGSGLSWNGSIGGSPSSDRFYYGESSNASFLLTFQAAVAARAAKRFASLVPPLSTFGRRPGGWRRSWRKGAGARRQDHRPVRAGPGRWSKRLRHGDRRRWGWGRLGAAEVVGQAREHTM